uniref:AAA+ ATPase domain-containing protein n=2 Tax=Daphnia magna TaxID=35525 RepID=A0A0P4YE06_9CRUS
MDEMGRRKQKTGLTNHNESSSGGNKSDQQVVEKVQTPSRVTPDISEPPNARKDDTQLKTGDNGREESAMALESDTSDRNAFIGSSSELVCQGDGLDLTQELLQLLCDETKKEFITTPDKVMEKRTEIGEAMPAKSNLVQPKTKSNTEAHSMTDQWTATVFIAAPLVKNHDLAIVGEDQHLGKWKQPKGKFERFVQIGTDLYIFKGIVPVPSGDKPNFKFVHVNDADNKIEYEGEGTWDNRTEELLPGSWNFFVFKPKPKSMVAKFWEGLRALLHKSETKEKIAYNFFRTVFDHTLEIILPDWDSAMEFISECLVKVRQAIGTQSSEGFHQFLNKWFENPELQVNFDQLFLLIVGACKMEVYSTKMKQILELNSKEFSLYLHNFGSVKRKRQDLQTILERIAFYAGRDFWWILFRITRHSEAVRKFKPQEVSESILKTLQEIPEVLLENPDSRNRVVDHLVRWTEIDEIYFNLLPVFEKNANYQKILESLLLQRLFALKTSVEDVMKILRSEFMKMAYQNISVPSRGSPETKNNNSNITDLLTSANLAQAASSNSVAYESSHLNRSLSQERLLFEEAIRTVFNRKLSDAAKVACCIPDYMLPIATPIVENVVFQKLKTYSNFSRDDYRYFGQLDDNCFKNFPQAKEKISAKLLKMTVDHVKSGSFQDIPTTKLIMLGLAEKKDIPFLERAKVMDLQKAMSRLPRKFFNNLHATVKKSGTSVEKTLKPYRKGATKAIVEQLENHFDLLEEILNRVRNRRVPLIELASLQDPQVLDCLKSFGLSDRTLAELRQEIEELRERHNLYASLYSRFSRSEVMINRQDGLREEENDLEEDDNDENDGKPETHHILDTKEWESYLKDIDSGRSILTLQDAMNLEVPLQSPSAVWLFQIKESDLFMEKIWHLMVKSAQTFPLCRKDLQIFVSQCATEWVRLARSVAFGSTSFILMGEIVRLQADPNVLSKRHLQIHSVEGVATAYRNFKNLQELRHLIGPFVAALRFFTILERGPIDALHNFVKTNLLKNWDTTTLAQMAETGILRVVNEDLNIDPERPETRNAMQFISSLVTDENRSPLIEWLREKTEKDMEAMGKILQGTLLVAYGQLQTLRTRIAPFLQNEFKTYQDLLKVVRVSEERFAQRISGRVQPIDCKWLANMLPEIQAAVRASIISPSEDAKEKLAKLRQVVIDPKNESYSIEIRLEPTGSLSMEELKQAFQLLDMAAVDDGGDSGELIGRTRRNVGLIEKLSEVFRHLYASGCITFTFRERIFIDLADLETEIKGMQDQLEKWTDQWKEIEEMPFLSLFSRGYLLQLADLIGRNESDDVKSILKIRLPSGASKIDTLVNQLIQRTPRIGGEEDWLSVAQLFKILRHLHQLIEAIFHQKSPELALPSFLVSYGRTLKSHFIDKAVVILNVPRDLLVGSSLAAFISLTNQPIEPSRILFVTTNTDKPEVERFMKLWSVAKAEEDFFIILHVERLTAACACAVREGVDRVLPERRAKLLLLAQHHHRVHATKSLGARLGVVSDRLLEVNFTADQLRHCFASLLPNAANLHFFTSKLSGCGKSQQAMQKATDQMRSPDYYRICVRTGSVDELLASLKKIENLSSQSRKSAAYLHLDVAHSVSFEFNDILLSLLVHGALFDPKKAKLGYWMISPQTSIAIEFASPFGVNEFPVIAYLGKHIVCECNKSFFSYDLAAMPRVLGQPVTINRSNALVATGKFLQLKQAGQEGLRMWDDICSLPETLMIDPLPEDSTFDLLVDSFQHAENRNTPTFSALNAMASFLYRHICAMITSMWFNGSAVYLFERDDLARVFKLNVFNLLLKVANDSINRCWSMVNQGKKLAEMDWTNRQRAMFLLGLNEDGFITGMNVVGRDANALKSMFHASLLPTLQQQCLHFQELRGFRNLMESREGAEVILNAMRSLLLLDGTATSAVKVYQLDSHSKNTAANLRLKELVGQDQGYVLTGDNITKMMFALYRIRCGLPVVAFGEAGVGKSALFRFLIQTLLNHTFEVCNVNSGTSIQDVEAMIDSSMKIIARNPEAQVFLFFDEMNTADPPVIAFFKELMLDRHCHGTLLPENLHLMAAANPYRHLHEADKEAAVGLAFRFDQSTPSESSGTRSDARDLVYRVNELPVAFYDHIYDFGRLCDEAENTYIEEICQHGLPRSNFASNCVKWFVSLVQKSHRIARALSVDPESAVSLRDVTRAVQLFHWFCQAPAGQKISKKDVAVAADLTIYLVYAFRFRNRKTFLGNVFGKEQSASKNMAEVSRIIAKMLYEQAHGASIGSGAIALNDALCENLFALYVCVLNGIFLIIVGRPGSSKSLSVEILKLVLSPGNHTLRHELGDLPAITELYFQCSPMSTSSGFKALFESAQRLSVDPKTMLAMVVLDELGLADMSPEKPIKVLHAELERQSVLTSGDKQQSPYSVVALSNWVVDAAQVNRGILILRTQADKKDLLRSAEQLADSLISKFAKESERKRILNMLTESLESVVSTYQELDKKEDIGGGHFFSMRDFFFCVKNFVCSVFDSFTRMGDLRDIRVSRYILIQSAVRNFGGHEKARKLVRSSMANNLEMNPAFIPVTSPLDLIVANIQDSSKPLSIHIARHLMILNRSLIGLQLLNRNVKSKLDDGTNWNVLFGSCFPGDLQVTAVTRKLRQVEQAIRSGGVLILCHADQLFESLYMVLNQQYWAQGEVTMTQIALGPSIRAIALPNGPFRIIALQDTDVALNRELMSPAILSRFEKHELRPSHLLDDVGMFCLKAIESHSLWLAVAETIKRQKFIYGYHEESFAALALYLQDRGMPMEFEEDQDEDQHSATTIWMRATNPMSMIKLERDSSIDTELLDVCRRYRQNFVLESIDDALLNVKSNRIVIVTNTLRHLEIAFAESSPYRHSTIQLFDILTELELVKLLESINDQDLADPDFCLVVQYDAVTGPIEQFQLAKYEIEQRFEKNKCRVIFVVHVDPRPVSMHWVFSFGDCWDYCFVDEVVPGGQLDHHRISLGEFVKSPSDQTLSSFIVEMSTESFKSLLLEMLGPVLQTSLATLRASLGQFYSGVRIALGLPNNKTLIKLMKECLLAQLNDSGITWNVVDAVSDPSFDSSSSLTEGLWGVFKHKISNPLAHFLLISDIWRITDLPSSMLWCDFVIANYPDRLMSLNSSDTPPQIPVGFRSCTQPFGRLLASFNMNYAQRTEPRLNGPLRWLLERIAKNEDENSQEIKEAYFLDWFLLRIPPHLHRCLRKVPLSKMSYLVDHLFEEPAMFFLDWEHCEADVIAALELASIASFATADKIDFWSETTGRMRNWKFFTETAARLSLETLASADVMKSHKKFLQSISSIELSSTLTNLLDHVKDLPQLWLGLRITKRILVFDPDSDIRLPELQVSAPHRLFDSLTDLVITSVIRPRLASDGQARRFVRQADLYALLKSTSSCSSPEELSKILGECPTTNSIVLREDNVAGKDIDGHCSSCASPLTTIEETEDDQTHPVTHLRSPNDKEINSLFEDHQKFMFFFERVAELFIQQRKNNPRDIQDFLQYLLSSDSRLRVSWRFMTVIVRTVLSTRCGKKVMDDLLLTIRCNRPSGEFNVNAHNLLRALLACADQDIRNNQDAEPGFDLIEAAMTRDWTVDRIQRLANIRKQIAEVENGIEDVIAEWSGWRKNQNDQALTDSLLFFILRFYSDEGDQTRLSRMFRNPRIAEELNHHKVVNSFIKTLSPLSLGFDLQPAITTANVFQERLLDGDRFGTGAFEHYPALREIQPDWAPFIARLAYHAYDIFQTKHFRLLREMATNLVATSQYLLPGIDNHPYLPSFTLEAMRWFVCNCGTLNCVGNCGHPTPESICVNCHVALSQAYPNPRAGVRRATARDFQPPTGIHVTRAATRTPTFAARNCSPVVTRFALLLNSLALMNAALNPRTEQHAIAHLLLTLPLAERQRVENRQSLIQLLSNHIIVHLDLLCQLLVASRPQLTMTDKFRIGHLLLHKLHASQDRSFLTRAADFANGTQARETFENGLTRLLAQQVNLAEELDQIAGQSDVASKAFRQSFLHNETSHWAYARRVFADRQTLQLELARNGQLRKTLPFLNLLLDDENWMRKLNALQYLGEALRFVALVRTVLAGEITLEEANRMTIAQGLEKITDVVLQKVVLLDRGRPVATREHVMDLFEGFKQLWDRFSQLQNAEKKTFLDYFECQQVDVSVRPKTILDQAAPLILILAGSELPETTFSCQLLSHAVEAASSIALTDFIQPLCRVGSGRVRLSCSSAAALTDFDESLYAHVSTEEVDNFIRDHVIDRSTLKLAESFAMAAILGPAGSTIAEELSLDVIPEFLFKDDVESGNFLVSLERRSIPWQPSTIPPQLQELILADLEKNRCLAEARSVLISVITHLQSNTEPLVVSKVRKNYISEVLEELVQAEVLTERHISNATVGALNRHLKLEVRHAFGLLKAIVARMKGDDIFGGRVREGWTTMIPERLAQLTRQKLRADAQPGGILETLLQMVNIISGNQTVPVELTPDKSLLYAIRQIEGSEWDGIPAELKMEHLGHLLLIVESVAKK